MRYCRMRLTITSNTHECPDGNILKRGEIVVKFHWPTVCPRYCLIPSPATARRSPTTLRTSTALNGNQKTRQVVTLAVTRAPSRISPTRRQAWSRSMNIGAAAAKRPPIPGAHHRFLSRPSMRPIRGCIQRGFCAAFPAACPAPEKKFAPDGCRYCSFEGSGSMCIH
jgi:hypothetical protein